jgi:hypothetical protein
MLPQAPADAAAAAALETALAPLRAFIASGGLVAKPPAPRNLP